MNCSCPYKTNVREGFCTMFLGTRFDYAEGGGESTAAKKQFKYDLENNAARKY